MTEKCYECKVEMTQTSKDHYKCPKCGETTWVIGKSLREIRAAAGLVRSEGKRLKSGGKRS